MSSSEAQATDDAGLLSDATLEALQLRKQPFSAVSADGDQFADDTTAEQLADIKQALINGDDLLLILGEEGAGKSTLIAQLAANSGLRIQCFTVRGGPRFTTRHLFAGMLGAFGEKPGENLKATLDALIPRLQGMVADNMLGAILLDDADRVDETELTRLLSSMLYVNSQDETLLRIALAAEEAFDERLPELLPEGANLRYSSLSVEPLSPERAEAYLDFRLNQAGCFEAFPFSEHDMQALDERAGGRPAALHREAADELNRRHDGTADEPPRPPGRIDVKPLGTGDEERGAGSWRSGTRRRQLGLGAAALVLIVGGLLLFRSSPPDDDERYAAAEGSDARPGDESGSRLATEDAVPDDGTGDTGGTPLATVPMDAPPAAAQPDAAAAETDAPASSGPTGDAGEPAITESPAGEPVPDDTALDDIRSDGGEAIATTPLAEPGGSDEPIEPGAPLEPGSVADGSPSDDELLAPPSDATLAGEDDFPDDPASGPFDDTEVVAEDPAQPSDDAPAAEDELAEGLALASPVATPGAPPGDGLVGLESPNWVLVQDPRQFTVQMSASRDRASVENFLGRAELDPPNSIFAFERDGVMWYALVHGLFPTLTDARRAVERMPARAQSNQPWIREVGRVQDSLKEQN